MIIEIELRIWCFGPISDSILCFFVFKMADLLREQSSLNTGLSNINDELSIREKASRRARIYAQIESTKKELKEDREKCMKEFREEVGALVFFFPACLTFIAWHNNGNLWFLCCWDIAFRERRLVAVCLAQEYAHCNWLPENIQRILNKISNSIFCTGRSSIDFHKTKTKVITKAIQSEGNHYLEPLELKLKTSFETWRKRAATGDDWFWFCIWLVERVVRVSWTNHRAE